VILLIKSKNKIQLHFKMKIKELLNFKRKLKSKIFKVRIKNKTVRIVSVAKVQRLPHLKFKKVTNLKNYNKHFLQIKIAVLKILYRDIA